MVSLERERKRGEGIIPRKSTNINLPFIVRIKQAARATQLVKLFVNQAANPCPTCKIRMVSTSAFDHPDSGSSNSS